MTVKTAASRGNTATPGTTADTATQATTSPAAWADASRQPMAAMSQAAAGLMRAAEILQQVQLQALQRAALGQQQAADKLRGAGSPSELMAVQASLMVAAMNETLQYTQDLATAAVKIQGELVAPPQDGTPTAAAMGATMNAMAAPMMQAWQTLFRTPLNGAAAQPH